MVIISGVPIFRIFTVDSFVQNLGFVSDMLKVKSIGVVDTELYL